MTTVHASTILRDAAALVGEVIDPATGVFIPAADTLARFVARFNRALPLVWEAAQWPEVALTERRIWEDYWDSTRSYNANETVVEYATGSRFVSLINDNADPLDTAESWWEIDHDLEPEEYDADTTYAAGDVVFYAYDPESWFVCIAAVTGEAPTNTDYWAQISATIGREFELAGYVQGGTEGGGSSGSGSSGGSSSGGTSGARLYSGTGSPEGVISAAVGSQYSEWVSSTSMRVWFKGSGTGNTGWWLS